MVTISLYKKHRVGKIEHEIFGAFIEHLGRSIYGGIYDPGSIYSDKDGYREDVKDLVRELGVDIIRYPGGNYVSGYDWRDGVGERKVRLNLAWGQTEPNTIGTHEFCDWAKSIGSKVMLATNMGTGTPRDAGEYVEYCNHAGKTALTDERAKNGRAEPFGIERWCIGNEMDGDWQIGTKKANEYGRLAHETAKIMKMVDPSIKLTVCGSSGPGMPTFPEWDRIVLENTYNEVEFLSLHRYYEFPYADKKRVGDFLGSFVDFDAFIKTGKATIEYVKAYKRSRKQVYLSVDEWNVWHMQEGNRQKEKWEVESVLAENHYTAIDAIVFATLMMTLLNNADCVKMACLAQVINVIAPILCEHDKKAIRQTTFFPFAYGSKYAKGYTLESLSDSDGYDSIYGKVPYIYTANTYDDNTGELTCFIVNTRETESEDVSLCFDGFDNLEFTESFTLDYNDKFDTNNLGEEEKVKMIKGDAARKQSDGRFAYTAKPLSFSVVRFAEK